MRNEVSIERAKPPLTWAIDCDDVLVPTAGPIVNALNELLGTQYDPSELYDFKWWKILDPRYRKAGRTVNQLLREGLLNDIEPDPWAIEAMRELVAFGDELHIVTSRQEYLTDVTRAMADDYFTGLFTSIEHTNTFSRQLGVRGLKRRTKGSVCAEIGADIIIDDQPRHVRSALKLNPNMEGILFGGNPDGRMPKLGKGAVQCFTWGEVLHERERILASR